MRWIPPVLLAAVFAFAAGAKLADRAATAEGFRALHLRHADRLAVAVPTLELLTAVLLIAAPRGGAIIALVLLLGFSGLLALRLRAGSTAPCRCFGNTRTRPIAWTDLLRNGVLAVLAVLTLVLPPAG